MGPVDIGVCALGRRQYLRVRSWLRFGYQRVEIYLSVYCLNDFSLCINSCYRAHDFVYRCLLFIAISWQQVCFVDQDSVCEDELSEEQLILWEVRISR